jgi:hypothetical protein
LQRLCFAGVEPDEFADATDFDFNPTAAIEGDFDHWVTTARTRPSAAAFVMNGMEPERIDRFRRKGAAQQLQTYRTTIAFFATPDDAGARADFGQWNTASGAKKFSFHRGNL